jgi:hypothetical protein
MPMSARLSLLSLAAAAVTAAACTPKGGDSSAAASNSGTSASSTTLAPTVGADSGKQLVDSVTTDDSLLAHAAPAQIESLVPRHVQLVTHTLVLLELNRRKAGAPADPAWTATADSVRADLKAMPTLSPAALTAMLPAHVARVQRLVATAHP